MFLSSFLIPSLFICLEYDVCGFLSRWMKGKIRTGSSLHPTHIPFARKLTHRPARKGIIRPGEWTVRSGPVISFHSLRSLIHSFPSTRSHPSLHSLTSLSLLSMSWWPKGMLGRTWRDRATLHSPTHRSSRIERWGGGLRNHPSRFHVGEVTGWGRNRPIILGNDDNEEGLSRRAIHLSFPYHSFLFFSLCCWN